MKFPSRLFFVSLFAALTACGAGSTASEPQLKFLSREEGLADLSELASKVRALYGPLEFKEERFNFKFEDAVKQAAEKINSSQSDNEIYAALVELLGRLEDGHISISFPDNSEEAMRFRLPFFLTSIEDKAIVAQVSEAASDLGISPGDELISIDGQTPASLMPTILKYSWFGNETSDKHFVDRLVNRPAYIPELKPSSSLAKIKLRKVGGTEVSLTLPWSQTGDFSKAPKVGVSPLDASFVSDNLAGLLADKNGTLKSFGSEVPFFFTDSVSQKFHMVQVSANETFLTKFGVKKEDVPNVFSALYNFNGKNILLIRQPGYTPENPAANIGTYQAIMNQYENLVDVLVVDQTHNPGGSLFYAESFFSLFVKQEASNVVQHMNADRNWIRLFRELAKIVDPLLQNEISKMFWERSNAVEEAYDAGAAVTAPIGLVGDLVVRPNEKYVWKKPVLVLADELAGSCGDIFPMLMKRNGISKIFGERTMGLGGNVEEVTTLTYTGASVNLTRGLFTQYREDNAYTKEDLVENNGILPDYPHKISRQDFLDGYVEYVNAFSSKAVEQISQ